MLNVTKYRTLSNPNPSTSLHFGGKYCTFYSPQQFDNFSYFADYIKHKSQIFSH